MCIIAMYNIIKKVMKKVIFILAVIIGISAESFAGNPYKVDANKVNKAFENASEIKINSVDVTNINNTTYNSLAAEEQTKVGYLVRAFFCGGIALHRQYMGSDWSKLWWKYFCIPVVGGVTACIDFWWVIFEEDAFAKYKGNDAYMVWNQ